MPERKRPATEVSSQFSFETRDGNTLNAEHIKNPLKTLSDDEKEQIYTEFYPVGLSAFELETESLEKQNSAKVDIKNHLFSSTNLILVRDNEGRAIAFRVWDRFHQNTNNEDDIIYLAGMCIKKDHQRTGIGNELIDYILKSSDKDARYVTMRTQNPAMIAAFKKTMQASGAAIFPKEDGGAPADIQDIAMTVAERLNAAYIFDRESFVFEGVYGASLYGGEKDMPNIPNVDQKNGDAILYIADTRT